MTDICSGPMSLKQIGKELVHYMVHKTPSNMVIDIKETTPGKYHTTFYIPIKDFKKKSYEFKNGIEKQKLADEH